jgi:hypothetical protein
MREIRTLWQFLTRSAVPSPCGDAIPDLAKICLPQTNFGEYSVRRIKTKQSLHLSSKGLASVLRSECWLGGHVRRGQQRNVATNQSLFERRVIHQQESEFYH